jgi:hypothetical protein
VSKILVFYIWTALLKFSEKKYSLSLLLLEMETDADPDPTPDPDRQVLASNPVPAN